MLQLKELKAERKKREEKSGGVANLEDDLLSKKKVSTKNPAGSSVDRFRASLDAHSFEVSIFLVRRGCSVQNNF